MKEKSLKFIKDTVFTALLAFFLISFLYIFVFFAVTKPTWEFAMWQFFRYIFLKLFACIFPFCLCLGLANRIFDLQKKNRALLRVVHLLATFAAYFIFMDLLFNSIVLDAETALEARTIIMNVIPFFVFYPLTLAVTALGRAIFVPKEKKTFKSILD